jgi:polysaccharide pyruvyl transferase WcaK-like protein
MKTFYLAGQRYFGNRGCEALVRTTVCMLREEFPDAEFLTPSENAALDQRQWAQAPASGVRFVAPVPFPSLLKWWYRAVRVLPPLKRLWIPRGYDVPLAVSEDTKRADAVIMIGGDNISLDYTAAGLLGNTAFSEMLMRAHKPVILWAASIGPFSSDPVIERYMANFLKRLDLITVRETVTVDYLQSIGVSANVRLVADPAFLLVAEPVSLDDILPRNIQNGLVGLNVSPLIDNARYGRDPSKTQTTQTELVRFIESVVSDFGLSVALIPHVDPLGNSSGSSDSRYMSPLMAQLAHLADRVSLVPSTLNAAQLKFVISKCRYFIGARTHSTIASLSSTIPTISIAYSVKARGLNRDLFGHERYVLPTPALSASTLSAALASLVQEEENIRSLLGERLPIWQERSRLSAKLLAAHLGN